MASAGPLTWPGDHARSSPGARERRLREAQMRAEELREQLARADAEALQLRHELTALGGLLRQLWPQHVYMQDRLFPLSDPECLQPNLRDSALRR